MCSNFAVLIWSWIAKIAKISRYTVPRLPVRLSENQCLDEFLVDNLNKLSVNRKDIRQKLVDSPFGAGKYRHFVAIYIHTIGIVIADGNHEIET